MKLDRGLIKAQAKELIRGKVMKLFLTVFLVQCIAVLPNIIHTAISAKDLPDQLYYYSNYFDDIFEFDEGFNDYRFEDDDDYDPYEDDFENFGNENNNSGKKDFYSFGTNFVPTKTVIETENASVYAKAGVDSLISILTTVMEILLMPLAVSLAYYFVLFIKGKEFSGTEGLKFIFKDAFTNNYGAKIGVVVLRVAIIYGLAMISFPILCIPVFIFVYSSYFAMQILNDYPQLSPWQAIKLSKKMIKGNRTELFLLDLSFIPWSFLCLFLFPMIYAIPYMETTKALYYENFRIRALQTGRLTEDDFLTDYQKMQKYAQQGANYNGAGYQPNPQNPYNPQQANAGQQYYQGAYQQNATQQQYYTPYQEVKNEPTGNCDASAVQAPPCYTNPVKPQTPIEPQTEPLKPSEKYTPVTPPSETYKPTEDTNE